MTMRLPPLTLSKYLDRLDELVAEGQAVPVRNISVPSGSNWIKQETYYRQEKEVGWPEFVEWRTKCQTLLAQIVPAGHVHRPAVEALNQLKNDVSALQWGIAFLKSIRNDLENGFLGSLASEVESELAADYLSQAERLLGDGPAGQFSHVPAAVLAGAVLEKGLRSLCEQLDSPEATTSGTGQPLTMTPLIEALKRRQVFNELTAKQLRGWVAIRNSAAHGQVDDFTKEQAVAMVGGVVEFLRRYL